MQNDEDNIERRRWTDGSGRCEGGVGASRLRHCGGVSKKISVPTEFPVVDAFSELSAEADVIIDFSNPELIDSLLAYATEKRCQR